MLLQVSFRDPVRFKHQKELFVASEGMYSGQVGHTACTHAYVMSGVIPSSLVTRRHAEHLV